MNSVHRAKRMIRPLVLALVLAGVSAAPAASTAQAATPFCGITWGSLAKTGNGMTTAPITNVRTDGKPASTASSSTCGARAPATRCVTSTPS